MRRGGHHGPNRPGPPTTREASRTRARTTRTRCRPPPASRRSASRRRAQAQAETARRAAALRDGLNSVFARCGAAGRAYGESSTFHLLFGSDQAPDQLGPAALKLGIPAALSPALHCGMLTEGVHLFHGSGFLEHRARRCRAGADRARVRLGAAAAAGGRTRVSNLAILGGRVLDPGQGLDAKAGIEIDEGIISGVGPAAAEPAQAARGRGRQAPAPPGDRRDRPDRHARVVDLHTHLYPGVSHYGIEPDTLLPRPGRDDRGRCGVARAPRRSPACAAT